VTARSEPSASLEPLTCMIAICRRTYHSKLKTQHSLTQHPNRFQNKRRNGLVLLPPLLDALVYIISLHIRYNN
jgi:hypothetical protein